MEDIRMVPDLLWIPRGVAKATPNKVKLDPAELQLLIQGSTAEDGDSEDDDIKQEVKGEIKDEPMDEDTTNETETELRFKNREIGANEIEQAYLKDFDEESGEENAMRGVAMYASNKDDPYITQQVDSDEEEEKDDIVIRPDDNLVAVAKVVKDEYNLDVYVYNQTNDDWYCHHHYILEAPPLCVESIQHDPGNEETGRGNLVALGTMDSKISIWDLDIINACVPIVVLGEKAKEKKSRKRRDNSAQGHSAAVICLAWNKNTPHVLGSGGADQQIVLWDLDEAKAAQILPQRGAEVHSIQWHPNQDTVMLAGMLNGTAQVIDCRDNTAPPVAEWKFGGQVEKALWNHFDTNQAVVTTDEGLLATIDTRKPNAVLAEVRAHEGGVSGVALSAATKGLLATAGEDQMLCIWKLGEKGEIEKVHSTKLNLGQLHSLKFNPDIGSILAVGGTEADLVRIVDLKKFEPVVTVFG